MKRAMLFILTGLSAVILGACGGTAPNTTTNTNTANTNAAKPTAAAPTKDALLAQETKAFEAFKNNDWKFFEGFLADNFVGFNAKGERVDKAATLKEMNTLKCEVKSYSLSDAQMTPVSADTAVLTLKGNEDYTCDGKKMPADFSAATVYVRSGDAWKAAYHNEVTMMDPKAPPPAKPASAKTDKETPADVKPADATTEALLGAIRKGWDAWKARDAAAFEPIVAKDFVLIDPMGQRHDRAGAIKSWTEPKCDIKGFTLKDPMGTMLGKDAGLLTLRADSDGSCEGMGPIGSLLGTYLLVKDGDSWKAVMIVETPA